MYKKLCTLVLMLLTVSASFSANGVNAKESGGRIDVVTTDQGDVYFYVPEDSKNLDRVSIVPIFLVFGDEDYTAESAKQTAISSGLAEIASREGSIVVFINPKDDTWSELDVSTYLEVLSHFTENERVATTTGDGPYPGFVERAFVYGEGSGADFVAENLAKQVIFEQPEPWGPRDLTPAFITLFNNTVLPSSPDPEYGSDIPIVAINPVEGTEERLKELNGKIGLHAVETSEEKEGFVKDLILSTYEELGGTTRRIEGEIVQLVNFEAEGISETIEARELSTRSIRYHQYIPNHLDMEQEGSIPLLMTFHGGGNTGEFHSLTSDWPLVGKEHDFIVVSVDRHVERTSEDMIELLEILFEEYPAIDKTRVYASGFSMGAVKTWNLGAKFPQYFAAISPMGAGILPEDSGIDQLEILPYTMPIFYIGGAISPLPELPSTPDPNVVDDALAYFLKMNKVDESYLYDENADETWGIAPAETYTFRNEVLNRDTVVSLYMSENNQIYTALASGDKSHLVYATDSWLAWDFISQFSRNSDGTITIGSTDDIEDDPSDPENEEPEQQSDSEDGNSDEIPNDNNIDNDPKQDSSDNENGDETGDANISEPEQDSVDVEDEEDNTEIISGKVQDNNEKVTGEKLPKTATNQMNMILIGTCILIIGGIIFFIGRKRLKN